MGGGKVEVERKKRDSATTTTALLLAFDFFNLLLYSRLTLVASILSGKLLVTPLMWHASMLCVRSFMVPGEREGKKTERNQQSAADFFAVFFV